MFNLRFLPKNLSNYINKSLVLNFNTMESSINYNFYFQSINKGLHFDERVDHYKNKVRVNSNSSLILDIITKDDFKNKNFGFINSKLQSRITCNNNNSNYNRNRNNFILIQNNLIKIMKRNFSKNFDINYFYYLEEIPNNNKELEIYVKRNTKNINHIMNNLSNFINSEENFNFEVFSVALFLNKFSEHSEKKKKSINNEIIETLRYDNYAVLNTKSFDDEKFLKLLSNLHMAKLSELDKEAIQNSYFKLKESNKFSYENEKKLFNLLYFFDISGNKIKRIKKSLFGELRKNYEHLDIEELYYYNSCLLFHDPKDLGIFYEPLYKKIDFILDLEKKFKNYSIEQKLFNYLPIPKLISETKNLKIKKFDKKNDITLNDSERVDVNVSKELTTLNGFYLEEIYDKVLQKMEIFLKQLSKEKEINVEFLIPILSNTYNYMELKSEIFELFVDKLYDNLAALSNDNYIELLFLIMQISKDDVDISLKRKKLTMELYNILLPLKTEPKIFMDIDKFYIYLNIARNNLNNAFDKFLTSKKIKDNNPKNFEQFKKLVKLSIDSFPFSVREKRYTSNLLEDCLISLNNILGKKHNY